MNIDTQRTFFPGKSVSCRKPKKSDLHLFCDPQEAGFKLPSLPFLTPKCCDHKCVTMPGFWPPTSVAKDDLELPLSLKDWDYRHAPPHPIYVVLGVKEWLCTPWKNTLSIELHMNSKVPISFADFFLFGKKICLFFLYNSPHVGSELCLSHWPNKW